MFHHRVPPLLILALVLAACGPAWAQSVISTHSGMVYFFDGSVFLADQPLEQKFGRFPDIGEGRELRTDRGRAEVLLTPGVFLRIGDHSAIRMLSTSFSDTRVELLTGSAIVEANERGADSDVRLILKRWHVRVPREGVYRIDAEPAQVMVYRGQAEVAPEGEQSISVRQGQSLPLATVLVPEQAPAASDDFKDWAMNRSQAISSDNATAAGIVDDPSAIESAAGTLDLGGIGGLSYFPLTGIPGIAVTNPYGLSFWSPFQSTLNSIYFPLYRYGSLYPRAWPAAYRPLQPLQWRAPGTVTHLPITGYHPAGTGYHPVAGAAPARPTYTPVRTAPPAAHPVARPSGRR